MLDPMAPLLTTTDKSGAPVSVVENPAEQRYEIHIDEPAALAGFTAYRDRPADGVTERIFFHTEVGEEFGGRGLATTLVQAALDDVNARDGLVVVGVCPLVAAFLKKHPDYAAQAHKVTPQHLEFLQTAV